MKLNLDFQEKFEQRHIAPNEQDTALMLETVGVSSIDELIEQMRNQRGHSQHPLDLFRRETSRIGSHRRSHRHLIELFVLEG